MPFSVLAQRTEALAALDGTGFGADDQTSLLASMITKHGRQCWERLEKAWGWRNTSFLLEQAVFREAFVEWCVRELAPHAPDAVRCDRESSSGLR
jgi:hypothetical protein